MIPNILDFLILTFIVACYFLSSLRGGVKQVFSFLVVLISFVVAGMFYEGVAAVFPDKVFPEEFAGAIGFAVVFLSVFGIISLVGRVLDDLFKLLHFGGVDRAVSIVLGLLKGVTLACMLVIIIMINYPADESVVADSVSAPYIMPVTRVIVKLLPGEEQEEFHVRERELKIIWQTVEEE